MSFEQRPGAGRVPRRSREAHGLQVGLIPWLGLERGAGGQRSRGSSSRASVGQRGPGFALGEGVNAAVGRGRPPERLPAGTGARGWRRGRGEPAEGGARGPGCVFASLVLFTFERFLCR